MLKLATPVSDLFQEKKYAKILMENSDCLEVRDKSIGSDYPDEEIFHCEMQPIHKLSGKNYEYLKKVKHIHPDLKLITFHCASSCDKPYLENGMFQLNGVNYEKQELLKNAEHNFSKIKEIFGKEVKIGIENNNYYPTEAYRHITDPTFISEIIHRNELYFLFDIAHARIAAFNKKIDYGEYMRGLPLDRIIQLHISSYGISDGLAYDIHDYPNKEIFDEVKEIINKYDVKYLTVEYYKDIENLLVSLHRTKEIIDEFHGKTFQFER